MLAKEKEYNESRDAYIAAYNAYAAAADPIRAEQATRLKNFCWGQDFRRHFGNAETSRWWKINEVS